jgi:hypothetical protein
VIVLQVLAMGAQKTMKEHQLVIDHFNNEKLLKEIAELYPEKPFYSSAYC